MKEVLFLLLGWFLGLFGRWLSDRILNDEINFYRFHFEQTFNSSNPSRQAVHKNLAESSDGMKLLCRQIADRIGLLLLKEK